MFLGSTNILITSAHGATMSVTRIIKIERGLPPIYTPNEDRIAGLTAIGFDFNFPKDCNGKLSNAKGTSNDREVLVAATIASTENNSNDAVAPAVKCTKTSNQHS